jgi:hypothetical protein
LFSQLPEDIDGRWRRVDAFLRGWPRVGGPAPLGSAAALAAAETQLAVRLPAAMREHYLRYPSQWWSGQDRWVGTRGLGIEGGLLVFRHENQGCCAWGIRIEDLDRDDPAVYCRMDGEVERNSESFTAFVIVALLLETMWRAPATGHMSAEPGRDVLAALRPELQRCDLPDRYWVLHITFSEGGDYYVVESHGDDFIYLVARTRATFDRIRRAIPVDVLMP